MGHEVHLTGEFLTHRSLWRTAQHFLAAGLGEPKGSFYPLLAAAVFGYFAFEAFLNAALREVARDVWLDEKSFFSKGEYRGTLGKYAYLAAISSHVVDKSCRPYQTVRELSDARDFLVHARTEEFDVIVPAEKLEEMKPHPSALDRYASAEFVGRAVADVEALSDSLHFSLIAKFGDIGIGSGRGAFSGIDSSWHASLVPEP
jgi:hypothetical protein